MNTIVIAGAGHGGLTAAAKLAENGFNVTVFEKQREEDLGYDWHDTVSNNLFDYAGITDYDPAVFHRRKDSTFYAPSMATPVSFDVEPDKADVEIDRAVLYRYLIKRAREAGATLRFSSKVTGPMLDADNKVCGVIVKGQSVPADLVIDAAGLFSPVLAGLPKTYGIRNDYGPGDIFHAYRAYFNLVEGAEIINPERFNIYFKFAGIKGIAWFKLTEGCADVLVGSVQPLTTKKVQAVLERLREVQPALGRTLVRGGQTKYIPIKSTFSLLVGDRYAAVGDCVSMPIPMTGSGITHAVRAGAMLADTVTAVRDAGGKQYRAEDLWAYQTAYYKDIGEKMTSICVLKNCLLGYSESALDFLFDKRIITAKELSAGGNGRPVDMGKKEILEKLKNGYSRPVSLLKLKGAVRTAQAARQTAENIPTEYNREAVEAWRRKLENILKN